MFRYLINCFKSPDPPQDPEPQDMSLDEMGFHFMFARVYKCYLIDVTSEMFGTSIDGSKLEIDPTNESFLTSVKELVDSTKTFEIDMDKPLTFRLLKHALKIEKMNDQRAVLQSFYKLKKRSLEEKRPIISDEKGDYKLGELSLNSGSDTVQDSIVEGTG